MNPVNLAKGFSIAQTATHLRNLAFIEKIRLKILAGWFLRIQDYQNKYALAYHLYDASEHVTWIRKRLAEMRAGNPNASVRPELGRFLEETIHAPSDQDFLAGFYGVLTKALLAAIDSALENLDRSANANEVRLLTRLQVDFEAQMAWYETLGLDENRSGWAVYLFALLESIGGLHGEANKSASPAPPVHQRFQRPETILFDNRIKIGALDAYEERQKMSPREGTIAQFRVFFNEFYAAALLASILFDAADGEYPWEFFEDFSRHFWDEVRHSEFGAIRLRELGAEPDRVNPILFEQSQGLPVLHRVAYLTRGLEAYFMPRKPKRMQEYEENNDLRSQLFADQDWSDEINHVRYGSRWTEYLLENDHREVNDIINEVLLHLSKLRGEPVTSISAPF